MDSETTMWLLEFSGFCGVAFYLGSYAMLQFGLLDGNGYTYAGLNLAAASLVLLSLTNSFNLWSAIIQFSWIMISLAGMTSFFVKTRRIRFTAEESALIRNRFPRLSNLEARKFLDSGLWIDSEPMQVLTEQGQMVPKMVYLSEGSANVYVDKQLVATCGPGSFLGELSVLSPDKTACATVILQEQSRYFAISPTVLRNLAKRSPDFRLHVLHALNNDARTKLIASHDWLKAA